MNDLSLKPPLSIAHVDADCFYVSCELMRNPGLRGKKVGVLSSQDACVVSKSYEAKSAGIKTGTTRWDAEKICPGIILIPADFHFYEEVSRKMFQLLREMSPEVEGYSIDEAFLNISGLKGVYKMDYGKIGDLIRLNIEKYIGITASVGVSTTKTLAKMASEKNKPNGLMVVDLNEVENFLKDCAVEEIWGVGKNRKVVLNKAGVFSAFQFYQMDRKFVYKLLGKPGLDLWHEIHSQITLPMQLNPPIPKGISRTASLGKATGDRLFVWAKLCNHLFRVSTALRQKKLLAHKISFFLVTKDYRAFSKEIRFERHLDNFQIMVKAIKPFFKEGFDSWALYSKCGVYASDIIKASDSQTDIFGDFLKDERHGKMIEAVAKINLKYGNRTIEPGILIKLPKETSRDGRIKSGILNCS